MSYKVEQEVKGKTYVYQVESYWDRDKQQSRQKRTYLGRKDPTTGKVQSTTRTSLPRNSFSFGGTFLLKNVIEGLRLPEAMEGIFEKRYEQYLYLAMFRVLTGEPYYLYPHWKDEVLLPDNASMDSQRISEILQELGEDEKGIERFFAKWISMNSAKRAIVFDVTSFSSYSDNNELLEYGYNRDKEDLEQVNLGMISKEAIDGSLHMPLAYRIYPGSIRDVSTLGNVLELIEKYRVTLSTCVFDRGFFSQENIKDLQQKSLNFLVSVPFSSSLAQDAVIDCHDEIGSPMNAFSFRNSIYFHNTKKISLNGHSAVLHLFMDKEKKSRQENKLMRVISEIESTFQSKTFKNQQLAEQFIFETIKSKKKFFSIKKRKGRFVISRNQKIIEAEVRQFGIFIFLTNQKLDKSSVLELYRDKDGVEKIFNSFKHDINAKRSRSKSCAAMKGNFFISFLSLIIISHVTQVMTKNNLFKDFSKQELFRTVSKLKVFSLANNQTLLAEVSRKQKNIFAAFGLKKINPSYNLAGL